MTRFLGVIAALIFALAVTPAKADELRPASIDFTERSAGNWSLDWKLPLAAPSSGRGGGQLVVPTLPDNCTMASEPRQRGADRALYGSANVTCEGSIAGGSIALPGLLGRSDALLRVAPLDRAVQSFRLTASEPGAIIAEQPQAGQVFRSYLIYGVEHILMGWDHLLFVIALVLLVMKPWPVVKAATAFTVAHSITLVATTLGFVGLPQRPVEALIALSIVYLAVELAKRDPKQPRLTLRFPWAVAFLFGLLHGFGFAGALRELGLPEGEVAASLLAFNLGVEIGQLLVVGATLALIWLIRRLAAKVEQPAMRFATYGIGIVGAYWLLDRAVFGV